jgi:hypothetical protein
MYPFLLKWLLVATVLLACISCKVDTVTTDPAPKEPDAILYLIPKGQHSTQSPFKFVDRTAIRFEATFDNSARYSTAVASNQADINKLYGVSDCGTNHHLNSARFGWRWYQDRLEIHAYTYVQGKRNTAYITTVQPEQKNVYELELGDEEYTFRVNEKSLSLPRGCSQLSSGYQLYPYFGGNEPAPHDVTIRIKEMN